MSTRALGAGGATSDFDAFSSTNPASIAASLGSMVYVQVEPEYRHLTNENGGSQRNAIARHPLASLAIQIRPNLFGGVSVSNFLDRSFETQERRTHVDRRHGARDHEHLQERRRDRRCPRRAWRGRRRPWLRLGVAGHVISGDNRLRSTEVVRRQRAVRGDRRHARRSRTSAARCRRASKLFAGSYAAFAVSYRKGNSMSLKHQDTTLTTANVPNALSMSAAFIGIKGTMLAVRTQRNDWTRMDGLGSDTLPITNNWDTSVGADVLGPHLGSHTVQVRAGGRWRTLPFGLSNSEIKEKTYNVRTRDAACRAGGWGWILRRSARSALRSRTPSPSASPHGP